MGRNKYAKTTKRIKPKHGPLRTKVERHSAAMQWPFGLLPREGAGDYRPMHGRYLRATADEDTVPHDHAQKYIPFRNGMPVGKPYVYGAPREAWAVKCLDLDAIAAADRQIDGKRTAREPDRVLRDTLNDLMPYWETDTMSVRDIAVAAGCSVSSVYKHIHRYLAAS